MKLTWSPDLRIGHDMIDSQHIELFSIFDKFVEGCSIGEGKETLLKLHNSLRDYSKIHFQEEETLMQRHNYPKLSQHKRAHQKFEKDLLALSRGISDQGPTLMSLVQTNKTLVSWLVNHVQDTDQQFGDFIKSG